MEPNKLCWGTQHTSSEFWQLGATSYSSSTGLPGSHIFPRLFRWEFHWKQLVLFRRKWAYASCFLTTMQSWSQISHIGKLCNHHFQRCSPHQWILLLIIVESNSDDRALFLRADVPVYSWSIYDNFTIPNEEELDSSCSQDYTLAWQLKAAGMMATLNDMIRNAQLCTGVDEKLSVISSTTFFFSQDSQVGRTIPF